MDDTRFWSLIDQARGGTEPKLPSAPPERMREILAGLDAAEVQGFLTHLYRRLCELNRWDIWGAGYTAAGGMGDDSFHYFRTWIVGKGRACYEAALTDPDSLGAWMTDEDELDNELLEYVPLEVLEERGITEDPRDELTQSPDDTPTGNPFDEDTVDRQYPRLAKRLDSSGQEESILDRIKRWLNRRDT